MTVYNELNKIAYIGNASQTLYPIPFEYINTEDIKVSIYTSKNEFVENWRYSTQYVIESGNIKILSGYAIDENKKLLILRKVDLVQDNKYREGGDFPAKSTEASFDKLTMITQQLQETLDRCVKVEVLDIQSPEELLEEVYNKLDSATEIAGDAINAANQAQTAADNATAAVNQAEQTLTEVTNYVDLAKTDIEGTKNTAISTIDNTVSNAKGEIANTIVSAKADINASIDEATMNISDIVSDAEGSITNIAVTEANKAIASAAQEATDTATANLNSYVDGTVKPSLQTYVDQAQADANSAATSMEQAALSATAASNYASNASADADNAAESATHAATSAADSEHYSEDSRIWAEGTDSEVQGLGGVHSSKVWADRAEQAAIAAKDSLPDQTGNADKFLTTDGTTASWAEIGGGFYNRVHDCILENPKHIIWEQDGNTLTLKAGTKLWYPDGRSVVLENDISGTMTSSSDLVWVDFENNSLIFARSTDDGPTAKPSNIEYPEDWVGCFGYVDNKFKRSVGTYESAVWVGDYLFPLPINWKNTSEGAIIIVDESTFNKGMIVFRSDSDRYEYIFIPQGIKTLACSGLKTDRSYNNVEYITPSVMALDTDMNSAYPHYFAIKTDGTVQFSDIGFRVTSDNYLQNLSTNEIFSGVRLGNYDKENKSANIYDTLDLQNSTRVFYWDD